MTTNALQRISRDELPEDFVPAWETLNKLTGEPAFVEAFATAPHVLNFVMGDFYKNLFFEGQVDQRYKQIVRLRLSALHGCLTCNKQNTKGAAESGLTDPEINAIMGDYDASDTLTGADKAVLRYADQVAMTNPQGRLDDELIAELQSHFSSADICELGTVMAVISGMAKLSFVMDLVEKESYCEFANG
ncbi:MAG: carboxymuconolactone decarboxylase family protein [Woeseiaceae bacterium]|nr:carboxymuconolactone decarboxylase family protein [Woeseiaceae bacterium]